MIRQIVKSQLQTTTTIQRNFTAHHHTSHDHKHGHHDHKHPHKFEKDMQMPTPRSFGFDMKYQRASNTDEPRDLAIICGWLGAKARQMKPYEKFYHDRGIDTLSFAVGPNHVIFPNKSLHQMQNLLDIINPCKIHSKGKGLIEIPPKGLIFHQFSVGGFLYGCTLMHLIKEPEKYGKIEPLIKAQIFDSPPEFTNIAKGVARSVTSGGVSLKMVEAAVNAYLKLTENTAGVIHRASSKHVHDNHVNAPSLFFFSKADPIASHEDIEGMARKWRGRGRVVKECSWEDTPHIQHARHDPDRYFNALEEFLLEHGILRNNLTKVVKE